MPISAYVPDALEGALACVSPSVTPPNANSRKPLSDMALPVTLSRYRMRWDCVVCFSTHTNDVTGGRR